MRTRNAFLSVLPLLAALVFAPACDKKDEAKSDAKSDEAKKDKPSLMLSNDTPACQQALACCEKMVEIDKGEATPEDINLSCSGVGMAGDDKTCGDFKKGYAMAIEAKGQAVPDACK
ncbi:MAG: hypothetical protein R6X02_06730 [Enhygromyxa sp.]